MAAKSFAKSILRMFFSDYRINWIYANDRTVTALQTQGGDEPELSFEPLSGEHALIIAASPTAKVRNSLSFRNAGLSGYVITERALPVCVAHFADKRSYDRTGTWPLATGEIALMDIATEERARGNGHASHLIAQATALLMAEHKTRIIAFIWWSNTPSIRAFEKAGWQRVGVSVEIEAGGRWRSFRLPLR
jgi:ribosomal protein S18 acetylase RimI-like enzyme